LEGSATAGDVPVLPEEDEEEQDFEPGPLPGEQQQVDDTVIEEEDEEEEQDDIEENGGEMDEEGEESSGTETGASVLPQPTTASATAGKEAPVILITTVDIGNGKSDAIELRKGGDPTAAARTF